jgi:L-iditol 2-dehydrogenase
VEPFTVSYRSIVVNGGCDRNQVVAVIGGGMIGLGVVAAASAMGAKVILIEPLAFRAEVARKLGAAAVISPSDTEAIKQEIGCDGADLVIEASGHPKGMALALEIARFEGRITMPHITIEYSSNLDQLIGIDQLIDKLHTTAVVRVSLI